MIKLLLRSIVICGLYAFCSLSPIAENFHLGIEKAFAATCTAQCGSTPCSFNWSALGGASGNWSCGNNPSGSDVIVIPAGVTVNITSTLDFGAGTPTFQIYGTLNFPAASPKIKGASGTAFNIYSGGAISSSSSSNQIFIGSGPAEFSGPGSAFGPQSVSNGSSASVSPLPVELSFFEIKNNKDKEVLIIWSTASEINNDHFDIQRSSDGSEYETVKATKGAGNSNSIINYSETDTQPLNGISYYRLVQVDFDGKQKVYDPVKIELSKEKSATQLSLSPNPAGDISEVQLKASGFSPDNQILVVLRDINGNEVYSKIIISDKEGSFNYAMDAERKIAPGVYLIIATSDDQLYNQKLIIR